MTSNVAKGGDFEQDVEQLLRLKGYSVQRNNLINGTQIDLVAKKNDLLANLCFVVECTDRDVTVGVDLVKQKAAVLLSLYDPQYLFRLIFVAKNGFTAEAKAYADSQPNVLLLTFNDLENQLIDFRPYVDWYLYNFENSSGIFKEGKLYKHYVELIAKDEHDNLIPILTQEIRRWLNDTSNNLIFLLGEYGSGKTSFCRHLVYQLLLEKYRTSTPQNSIPILINLREHRSGAPNLQQVITDTLINQYGVQLSSFMAFEHVCSSGRVLLVLDGFDEMADKSDKQSLIDCFNQIYLLATLNTKVILTCRSNFFQSHSDVIDLLKHFSINIPFGTGTDLRTAQLDFSHHGRILFIEKLNQNQIREFISKRFGDEAESIFTQINSIHDLSDLSSRPVLLDMILTTLPELAKLDTKINSAALYQHYTNKWTARDDWRVKIPLSIRQNFSEILGWSMHNAKIQEIDFSVLEKMIARSLKPVAESAEQFEIFKNDIQTCSFLVRVGRKDQFRFAHKSFQEFFVARKIITDLSEGLTIKKPSVDELITDRKTGTGSISMHEWVDVNMIWPSSTFNYVYGVVDGRLRESDAYITLSNSILVRARPDFRSAEVVRSHIEDQIRDVLGKSALSDTTRSFNISQEIATFAIEYLENTNTTLKDFISKLSSPESVALFSDLLRLSQSTTLIENNIDYIKEYVKSGEDELLKISLCVSLAKIPSLLDYSFIIEARAVLSAEGWSYVLFEISSKASLYKEIINQCYEIEDLSTLDKLICAHGLYGQQDEVDGNVITESLVEELLNSTNEHEKSLGLTLCQSINFSHSTLLRLITSVITKTTSAEVKEHAISILGSLEGNHVWQALRALLATEKDPSFKKLINESEQRVRNATSRQSNRISWDQAKKNQVVRDKMWQALRKQSY